MIYLIGKIVLSLLTALGIGFGMAWTLQMHLAARLREQLNSVIFETKSRIPQLESEITNRDQVIDGLREDLAKKPKAETQTKQPSNKEQEKLIDGLQQKIIDLENELRVAKGETLTESVLELDDSDRHHIEEPELLSDDEFLADIQDIFDDTDDSINVSASANGDSKDAVEPSENSTTDEDKQKSLEEELQSELEGWETTNEPNDSKENAGEPTSESLCSDTSSSDAQQSAEKTIDSIDLKAELLDLEEEICADSQQTKSKSDSQNFNDVETLRGEVESLSEARKELSDLVDSQAKELSSMEQQRDLQDKSLSVLNQQLELARMANERILRELREVKDGKASTDDTSRSASGGQA